MSSFYMFSQWRRLIFLWIFVEERAPVHVGISDAIVTVDVQRAGIVTIPSVATKFDTAETAPEESTYFRADAETDAKLLT